MDWLEIFLSTWRNKKRRKKKELSLSQRTNNVRKRNFMTNWFFGMVTILQFVTIKMSRKWRCGKNLKGRFASDFKLMRSLFLIFDSATNSSPIVNCQIVNNCCHDKDLKEIFKSDAIRLVVSFKSLSMQTSSIYKFKPVNMYIIVAMAKNLKGSFWQMQIAKSCLSHLWQGDQYFPNCK